MCVAIASFVVYNYRRDNPEAPRWLRTLLISLRLALVGLVLFMLAQMVVVLHRTGSPHAAVLVDDSLSMKIVDRYDDQTSSRIATRLKDMGEIEPSRWNLARTLLTEEDGKLLARLADDYKLRVYFLAGGRSSPQADNPQGPGGPDGVSALVEKIRTRQADGPTSRLGAEVRTILDELRGTAPAAIVLLTDGINTDGPTLAEAATLARRKRVPLFFVGLGSDVTKDRRTRSLRLPRTESYGPVMPRSVI